MKELAQQTIAKLRDLLQVDAQWCSSEVTSFTWLPHRFCQTVSAEEPIHDGGFDVFRIHARIHLLRDVDTDQAEPALAALNTFASMSALTLDNPNGDVYLQCAAWFHVENAPWLTWLFSQAVALQAAEAHALLQDQRLAKALGSGVPAPHRPKELAVRDEPDEMLQVVEQLYRPFGRQGNPFRSPELADAENLKPAPWLLANSDEAGLTAQFPFEDPNQPDRDQGPQTSLLQATTTDDHPTLGPGLLLRLTLPLHVSKADAPRWVNGLNLMEASEFARCHAFGAWCVGRLGLTHVSFFPALAHRPRLLRNLLYSEAIRNIWAQEALETVDEITSWR